MSGDVAHWGQPGRSGPRGRGRKLIPGLRLATVLALLASIAALAAGGTSGDAIGTGLVVGLATVPAVRVAFLAVRWVQLNDPRFALAAALLLAEIGLVAALVTAT